MTRALSAFSYGHGGLGVCLIALAAGFLLPTSRLRDRDAKRLLPWLAVAVGASFITELCLTTAYLFSPGYLDHIEASVASNVHALLGGQPLYPPTDSYTFGGLLYGPLLAELNSLGCLVLDDASGAKLIGWLAGWGAVIMLITQSWRRGPRTASVAASSYALCILVSVGPELTVDRAEPLLLLFAACSVVVAQSVRGLSAPVLLGLLCGAAIGLKIHAALYIVPALYLWASAVPLDEWRRRWIVLLGCIAGPALLALMLPFLPTNVSPSGYLLYLTLATKHGLSGDLFGRNVAFLLGLWAPWVLVGSRPKGFAIALLACECIVLILASKPGAGFHHFIPFLAVHAFVFQDAVAQSTPARTTRALIATVLGMVTPTIQTFAPFITFDLHLAQQREQRDELLLFADQYPHGMLGVAGDESYPLTHFRPWLTGRGIQQTDYGAYMDLALSGVSDGPLAEAFQHCEMPFVYLPKPGEPFTVTSRYSQQSLFSNDVRDQFAASFLRVKSGVYFDVFACRS